jgi:hypothetical protein
MEGMIFTLLLIPYFLASLALSRDIFEIDANVLCV